MIINWRDRYDTPIGTVRAFAATYSAATDGTDELTLLTPDAIEKGQRLLWRDENDRIQGLVHEMIVSSVRTVHDKRGKALHEVKAINSIAELYWTEVRKQSGLYVPHYTGQTDSGGNPIQNGYLLPDLMTGILTGTRWDWVAGGHFDIGGAIAYVGMRETYDVSVREIIAAAVAGFNGAELRTYVFADDDGTVTHRYVSIAYPTPGASVDDLDVRGRFTYSKNVTGVTRDVGDSECYTAVRIIGADILDSQGAVTGRHEVYLESQNQAHLQAWGKPMPNGTVGHSVYTVTTSEESDATLLEMAAETLEEVVTPDVTYTINAADLRGIRLREYVDVIDEEFPGTIRMRARVTSITQDLLNEARGGVVTIGKTMNYAAVATSYQANNAVTASSSTDSAKNNRVSSSGRSTDSTSSRVSTAERQIADLNERVNQGGGGLSWPLIANKGWWNSDDSFAFFNKGGQWGLTGKDNELGVYAMADGLTPSPSSQQWNEGSPVWEAKSGTIEGVSGTKPWLSVVHAAIQYLRFTSVPNVAHVFAQRIENPVGRGISALGFGYSGGGLFAALEPYAASTSHPGLIMRILKDTSTWVDWLRISTTSTYAFLNMYGPSASGNGSSHHSNLNLTSYEGGYGSARIFANGSSAASYYAEVKADVNSSNVPTVLLRVRDSTASGQGYGLKITHSGIYAYKNGTETAIHTF